MIRNVVIHAANEQPLLVDLFELPSADDVGLVCTNLRMMDGKRPIFIDHIESTFFFPYHVIRFLEIPKGAAPAPSKSRRKGPAAAARRRRRPGDARRSPCSRSPSAVRATPTATATSTSTSRSTRTSSSGSATSSDVRSAAAIGDPEPQSRATAVRAVGTAQLAAKNPVLHSAPPWPSTS